MPIETLHYLESRAVTYAFDVSINAPIERVWDLLTHDIASWWPKDYFSSLRTQRFVLESCVGGRMFEDRGNGNGRLWGTVIDFDENSHLQIQGPIPVKYGGPGTFILSLELVESANGCTMKISDSLYGHITTDFPEMIQAGWEDLFGNHLKNRAEA